MTSIGSFSSEPFFTIKTVQKRTNIKPVTLRAWERRYELLTPTRLSNGYRLYSERDIQLLLWVQRKLESGISISQVVQQLKHLQSRGQWPETVQKITPEAPRQRPPRPAREYAEIMFGAMVSNNEKRATTLLDEVQKYFDLTTIFQEVLLPSLELLDEAWYRGEILLASVHMAQDYVKAKLMNIMHNLPIVKEGTLILVGLGPDDTSELKSLMLAILLRQQGYLVEYLGPDLQVDDLIDYSQSVRPKLICLTVETENTAFLIKDFAAKLSTLRGKPKLAYLGRYLDENEKPRTELGGIYLGPTLSDAVTKIRQIITII